MSSNTASRDSHKAAWTLRAKKDIRRNYSLYLMVLPVLVFYVVFSYAPIGGVIIAFKNYTPGKGIFGSPWADMYGFAHFIEFFNGLYFWRLIRNTVLISLYNIIFGFPAPIILALLINEVRQKNVKRAVQTITYFPHFISQIVICGMLVEFCLSDGLFNYFRELMGLPALSLLQEPSMFRPIYIASGIWQGIGWNSIIYLAAIASVDPQLYEAAALDGAGRLRCIWSITLPAIQNTLIIMLIMLIGRMMSVGSERIILLYNPTTYETADVISSYVYRRGLLEFDWSFSTAVNLFNSVINFIFVIAANYISGKVSETSLF